MLPTTDATQEVHPEPIPRDIPPPQTTEQRLQRLENTMTQIVNILEQAQQINQQQQNPQPQYAINPQTGQPYLDEKGNPQIIQTPQQQKPRLDPQMIQLIGALIPLLRGGEPDPLDQQIRQRVLSGLNAQEGMFNAMTQWFLKMATQRGTAT